MSSDASERAHQICLPSILENNHHCIEIVYGITYDIIIIAEWKKKLTNSIHFVEVRKMWQLFASLDREMLKAEG